jgi:sirohydrochlorin ferrochelatase
MTKTLSMRAVAALVAGLLVAGSAWAAEGEDHSKMDHSQMDHSQMDHSQMDHAQHMQRDAQGRIGYGMKHEMSPELMKELREKIPSWRDYTDAQIALSMDNMGPEYTWYVSPPDVKGSQGVLILTHGFREAGDRAFKEQVEPLGRIFPTAMGIGMAMMMSSHIQRALDDLQAAGAKEVVVLPITASASNELYRQWLYIFGKQDEAEFASVPRVKTDMTVKIAEPPGDNPLIAEILVDRALEISTDPKNEIVIVTGHGPSGDEDNAQEMKALASLAEVVREEGGFAAVYAQTLQDDAPLEVRDANVKRLRGLVEAAAKDGKRVLVVTNLIAPRSIQAKLRQDLEGLDYEFNAKGIVQHDNFMRWMTETVREAFERKVAACC